MKNSIDRSILIVYQITTSNKFVVFSLLSCVYSSFETTFIVSKISFKFVWIIIMVPFHTSIVMCLCVCFSITTWWLAQGGRWKNWIFCDYFSIRIWYRWPMIICLLKFSKTKCLNVKPFFEFFLAIVYCVQCILCCAERKEAIDERAKNSSWIQVKVSFHYSLHFNSESLQILNQTFFLLLLVSSPHVISNFYVSFIHVSHYY